MITNTSTGLRHTATQGFYSGEVAETGVVPTTVKRGRGRPAKNVSESGAKFDFSAFTFNPFSLLYPNKQLSMS